MARKSKRTKPVAADLPATVLAIVPSLEPTPPAALTPPTETLAKQVCVYITGDQRRMGHQNCRCGAELGGRSGRFVLFEHFENQPPQQLCDACAERGHADLMQLLHSLREIKEQFGCSPPILFVNPEYSHAGCAANCGGSLGDYAVWPILRIPLTVPMKHEGRCRRCWNTMFPAVMAVLESFLGLAPLAPVEKPKPIPLTAEQIRDQRHRQHLADLCDILTSADSRWRGGRHFSPGDGAARILQIIDTRIADACLKGEK